MIESVWVSERGFAVRHLTGVFFLAASSMAACGGGNGEGGQAGVGGAGGVAGSGAATGSGAAAGSSAGGVAGTSVGGAGVGGASAGVGGVAGSGGVAGAAGTGVGVGGAGAVGGLGGNGPGGSSSGGSGGANSAGAGGTTTGGAGGASGSGAGGMGATGGGGSGGAPLTTYVPQGDAFSVAVPNNLSGITYSAKTDRYYLIRNNAGTIHEYSRDFQTLHRVLTLQGNNDKDFEAIAHLGGDEFIVANEGNRPVIVEIFDDGSTNINANPGHSDVQEFELPPRGATNSGLEGICFDPSAQLFYAVQERSPMRFYSFPRPAHGNDVSHSDGSLGHSEPFDAATVFAPYVTDLSGCVFDRVSGNVLAVSHEGRQLLEFTPAGVVVAELALTGAPQFEGVTFGPNREIVVVSEPNWVRVYEAM